MCMKLLNLLINNEAKSSPVAVEVYVNLLVNDSLALRQVRNSLPYLLYFVKFPNQILFISEKEGFRFQKLKVLMFLLHTIFCCYCLLLKYWCPICVCVSIVLSPDHRLMLISQLVIQLLLILQYFVFIDILGIVHVDNFTGKYTYVVVSHV